MANTRHPKCAIRSMAVEAKKRLQSKAYGTGEIPAPAGISPAQRRIYIRLRELRESGEEVVNPIQQLADKEFMKGCPTKKDSVTSFSLPQIIWR